MDYDKILDEELLHLGIMRVIARTTQINEFIESTLTNKNYFKLKIPKNEEKAA